MKVTIDFNKKTLQILETEEDKSNLILLKKVFKDYKIISVEDNLGYGKYVTAYPGTTGGGYTTYTSPTTSPTNSWENLTTNINHEEIMKMATTLGIGYIDTIKENPNSLISNIEK